VEGKRVKPNGEELEWLQLGVLNVSINPELPFFIQWISGEHPSESITASAMISKINIGGDSQKIVELISESTPIFDRLNFTNTIPQEDGILSVEFKCKDRIVEIF
jgi:hypothetical protein